MSQEIGYKNLVEQFKTLYSAKEIEQGDSKQVFKDALQAFKVEGLKFGGLFVVGVGLFGAALWLGHLDSNPHPMNPRDLTALLSGFLALGLMFVGGIGTLISVGMILSWKDQAWWNRALSEKDYTQLNLEVLSGDEKQAICAFMAKYTTWKDLVALDANRIEVGANTAKKVCDERQKVSSFKKELNCAPCWAEDLTL